MDHERVQSAAYWFTNRFNNTIGRITTSGVVSHYSDPSISSPNAIAAGPGGALWFANFGNNTIGRITTSGVVSHYSDPGISSPNGIAAGPDGALWFTNGFPNGDNSSIGRITTSGVVTNYRGAGINEPLGIVAGPDGALWFTNGNNSSIGRITTSGVVTNYRGAGINEPLGIVAGPDSALWFTNGNNNTIGRISTSGAVSDYSAPSDGFPIGIAAGPDGALWFTNFSNISPPCSSCKSIGRITTSGAATIYSDPSDTANSPFGMAAGPDGAVWFTNGNPNFPATIGRIQVPPPLLGNPQLEQQTDDNPAGLAEAFRTNAAATKTLSNLTVYLGSASTAAKVVVGLYRDRSGHPGTLLAQATLAHPVNATWNTVSLPATAVSAGKRYWFALLGPRGAGTVRFRDDCCGGGGASPSETSAQKALTSLPTTWRTGTTYQHDGPVSAYGN